MNDRPDARDLLEIARYAFVAEVLPAVPEALRYTALMIANAIAIAQREIAAGDAPLRGEYRRFAGLLSGNAAVPDGDALRAAVEGYNRRLANEIRAGRFDGEERAAMLEHLRRTTEEKLAVSNPKALVDPAGK
ncbi:MAG: DUF6285 domain-containing protein [Betaproteobacteria bacterium]|nr:DUF6285 domain-containing protein [Betaproteobacteria bacterium]MDH3435387.1 DUF6285 domain-containing protein [Betaproteobacteria bacterium]